MRGALAMTSLLGLGASLGGCPLPTGDADEETERRPRGDIPESEFVSAFKQHFCEMLYQCDPQLSCDTSRFEVPEACVYVPERARACLEGEYTCTEAYGFEFVRVPPACMLVYECPYTSGTGLLAGPGTGSETGGSGSPTTYSGYY